jgi:hypothetical protein
MTPPLPDQRLVYLHCSSIFKGANAQIRRQKKILQVLEQQKSSIKTLTKEFKVGAIAVVAKVLLDQEIFESKSRAKLHFPELFQPSETQEVEREASEAEVARIEAEAVQETVVTSDEEWDEEVLAIRTNHDQNPLPSAEVRTVDKGAQDALDAQRYCSIQVLFF